MNLYEIFVGDEYRGDVTATDKPTARRVAKGELWHHGEGATVSVQLIAARPTSKKTKRPNWRTKTGELRKRM